MNEPEKITPLQKWLSRLGLTALLAVVGVGVFQGLVYPHTSMAMEGVVLPEGVDTLEKFRRTMPAPYSVYFSEYSSNTFIVVGPINNSTNPSGPPVYVFDESGRLKYWSVDTGDDPDNPATRAYQSHGGRLISLDEAIEFARAKAEEK